MLSAWCMASAMASGSNGLTINASVNSCAAPAKLRQDQHARIFFGLGGDEFLGHQVHAVA